MIELTEEQRRELSVPEPVAIDPSTNKTYVLVRKNGYDRMKGPFRDSGDWTDDELRRLLARSPKRMAGTNRRWTTTTNTRRTGLKPAVESRRRNAASHAVQTALIVTLPTASGDSRS